MRRCNRGDITKLSIMTLLGSISFQLLAQTEFSKHKDAFIAFNVMDFWLGNRKVKTYGISLGDAGTWGAFR